LITILRSLDKSLCILFADDTTVFKTGKDQKVLAASVAQDMLVLTDWFRANKLSLNLSKTNCILFRPKNVQLVDNFSLQFGNFNIEAVTETKFLGLWIDEHLTWTKQTRSIYMKTSSGLYMMRNVRNILPAEEKRMLYMSFIHSHLTYGIMLWGPMALAGERSKLFTQQKKALRIIDNAPYNAHASPLFKKHTILKLEDMVELELAKFMYSFARRLLPPPLMNFYQSNDQRHNYNTRGKRYASTPSHSTAIFNKSYLVRGPAIWRTLIYGVKESVSVGSLTSKIKDGKIDKY